MSDDGNELGADPYGICMKCGHGRHRGFACFDKIRFGPQAGERCPCVRKLGPTCDVCGVDARILISEHADDGDRMVCPEPIPCMKRRFALADAAAAPEVSERLGPPLVPAFTEDQVSITAVNGKVRWEMTPGRARKVARLLRNYSNALSEADRLDTAATQAEEPPRSIHSQ